MRRTEFSSYGIFAVQNFRRNASFDGFHGIFKLRKTKFSISKVISSILILVKKLNILWFQEQVCFHSFQRCFACIWYSDLYVYTYIYWKLWKGWMVTLKCVWIWMFKTCYVLYKCPNFRKCSTEVVLISFSNDSLN